MGLGGKIFVVCNTTFMLFLMVTMLYPVVNTLAVSLSSFAAYAVNPTMIIPQEFNLDAYYTIFNNVLLLSSYRNTLIVTIVGTTINMLLTATTAYPLSKRNLKGIRVILFFMVFTMLFSGGIIPNFMLIRDIGLLNTIWALMLPVAINTYNLILVKSYYQSIPASLEESAKIEGANDIQILFKIIIPVSVPTLVAVALFYTVGNWNQYFLSVMYTNSRELWTLQVLLREMVSNSVAVMDEVGDTGVNPYVIRCATIMVVCLPILFVYPFLQKYFMKGIMLGAVKA